MGYLNIPAIVTSLVVLSLAAIGLNSLSIYIITSVKTLWKKTSNLLLLNLLVVHLFQGIFVFPFYAGKKIKMDFEPAQFFGNGFRFTYMLTFYGTCLGILCIAVDRFLATYLLTKYRTVVTRKRVSVGLILLWVYIIALCLIPFVDVKGPEYKVKFDPITNTTIRKEKPKFYVYQQQREWTLFMLIFNTAVPYVLIILCYVYIIVRLQRMGAYSTSTVQKSTSKTLEVIGSNGESIMLKKKDLQKHKQVTKLTLILTFLYGLFWTPSIIYYPLKGYCKSCFPADYEDSKVEQHVGYITKYLAFLDAAAAPLLYCFMHAEFQNSLKRLQSKLLRKPPPEVHQQISSQETTDLL